MLLCDHFMFWIRHFQVPDIGLQLQFAESEAEYGALVEIGGFKMVRKKKRHRRTKRK